MSTFWDIVVISSESLKKKIIRILFPLRIKIWKAAEFSKDLHLLLI